MNAYELADYIELHKYNSNYKYVQEAITMLRQQADRIAELEKGMNEAKIVIENLLTSVRLLNSQKQLSDEEIWAYSEKYIREKNNILEFARAIIKASRGEE